MKPDINAIHTAIDRVEASFALKVSCKDLLPQDVVNDIFAFCSQIHSMKLEVITSELKELFANKNNVKIQDVTETISLVDHVTGLGNSLTTHYRRDQMLKTKFNFIEPVRVPIGKNDDDVDCFYYSLPISKTLDRLLSDGSVRSLVIHTPTFENPDNPKKIYESFSDGKIIRTMNIDQPYILLRLYLDAFGCNNPIGSSSAKHKVLGFYYSIFTSLESCSKLDLIQTLALLFEKDVEFFGLSVCLKATIDELKKLVLEGLYDKKFKRHIQVRVISSLGDNLEQVSVCGIRKNFSTMQHACRKCFCSKSDLCNADTYVDIHADNFWPRTDELFQQHFKESLGPPR